MKQRIFSVTSSVFVILLLLCASPPARADAPTKSLEDRLDAIVKETYANENEPGAAVLVVVDGKPVLRKGYGVADMESGAKITPEHVFRIGSVTKQFTAVAILQLVEQGKVKLDDPITKYVPDFDTRGKTITSIEGLAAADGTLHPVQQGVVAEQGFQCAFCMPGFVMATVGYLKTNPNPTRQELAHGISGNLCRCQDYDKILTAMMHGAELMRRG